MKKCSGCFLEQPEENFSWKVKNVRRSGRCKDCHKKYRRQHYLDNRQKYIEKARRWEAENGGKIAIRYNLGAEELADLIAKFDGKCWICRSSPATHVDHDHSCCPRAGSCGKCVRGILCRNCNNALGLFADNTDSLARAIEYLYDK